MTPRERELAQRHLLTLEDLRDRKWHSAIESGLSTSKRLAEHAALEHAIKVVRADLAQSEATQAISTAA